MNPNFPTKPGGVGPFSPIDIDHIPETPQRGAHHRRAHSDTLFRFSDDLLFDVSDVDLSALDLPIPTSANAASNGGFDVPMAVDSCRSDESSSDNKSAVSRPPQSAGHLRSLSVDADFFEGLSFGSPAYDAGGKSADFPVPSGGKRMGMHRRNSSMDGSASSFEGDSLTDGVLKKAMAPEKLAELALMDPRRAKRILANRQSAARSKERKIRYTGELERKVQTLQTEATTLSAQVTMLQRDTSGLTAENRELKLRLQAMEQQAHLRDALNEALREEVQRLRIATGQIPAAHTNTPNGGKNSVGGLQTQQLRFHPSQMTIDGQKPVKQLQPGFLDFNHRV